MNNHIREPLQQIVDSMCPPVNGASEPQESRLTDGHVFQALCARAARELALEQVPLHYALVSLDAQTCRQLIELAFVRGVEYALKQVEAKKAL